MLFLLCEVDRARYALDVRQVAEVLPLVRIQPTPEAPAQVAGLLNYRGAPVPVVDLSMLLVGRPSPARLSSRIVVLHYADGRGPTRLLALIAEHAIQTIRRDATDFVRSGIGDGRAACTEPSDDGSVIQWLDVNTLLPSSLREVLFTADRSQ
jgi:chemotaxis-related protein WspB